MTISSAHSALNRKGEVPAEEVTRRKGLGNRQTEGPGYFVGTRAFSSSLQLRTT
jgi:hypothetical protein